MDKKKCRSMLFYSFILSSIPVKVINMEILDDVILRLK